MQEDRIISFRTNELADALALFRHKSAYEPVAFDTIEVVERKDQPVLECWDRSRDERHHYYDHEVCSALMLYCMQRGVPLPRRGSKSVHLGPDTIRLVISLSEG